MRTILVVGQSQILQGASNASFKIQSNERAKDIII